MSINEIAEQVESAVKVGDALGKSEEEIHADVRSLVGHLPLADIDAVHQRIADPVASDRR